MPSIDVKKRRIDSKIVYYGPGQSGKSENLRQIAELLDEEHCGRLVTLPTKTDASLSIDVLPVRFGKILGFATTFHVCSGPGQAMALSTRRLLLRDTDGIVFVADSRPSRREANIDSLRELQENLRHYSLELVAIPHVIQYNRRDLKGGMDVAGLRAELNKHGVPEFAASALNGRGVIETLRAVVRSVSTDLEGRL